MAYEHVTSNLYFYNEDGSTLLYTQAIVDGGNGTYSGSTPSKVSTAQYSYTFAGWSKKPRGAADSTALQSVTADRSVYAAFTATVRKYTVYFYVGSSLWQTVSNVPYGGSATYTGDTPVSPDGSAEDYPFEGWQPQPTNITGNTSCYAQFGSPLEVKEIADSWDVILASIDNGTYKDKYKIGNYKPLDLGAEGIVNMQIVGMDVDAKASGGVAPISWLSKELLKTSKRWNPSYDQITHDEQVPIELKWVADSDNGGYKSDIKGVNNGSSPETIKLTPTESGKLSISYKVSSEKNFDKLTIKVNGTTVANAISGEVDWTDYETDVVAGADITIEVNYTKDATGNKGDDTGYVKWSGVNVTSELVQKYKTVTYIDMAKGGTIDGWESSELRTYYRDTLYPLIPESIRAKIVPVTKSHTAYKVNADKTGVWNYTQTSEETVWCPSRPELFDARANGGIYRTAFPDDESRKKQMVGSASFIAWRLRSASDRYNTHIVTSDGPGSYSGVNNSIYALVLGFCT